MAFERALQETITDEPKGLEPAPSLNMHAERANYTMLGDLVESYTPAITHTDLLEQVHLAKEMGADSIEADPKIVRQLTLKSGYPTDVGYLWYHDVRVWIAGYFDTHKERDTQTIEQKVFGKSAHKIQPIMDLGDKPK